MKNGILIFWVALSISITALKAQITIRENEIVEKPVFKPKQFDSLTNITSQEHTIDYKKFIGYKLFFPPKSKNYKPQYGLDNQRIINYLFSNNTIQIVKDGKIPFEQITDTKLFGDPTKLQGEALEQYNKEKRKYENIDKEKTNIYLPHFYHERTDPMFGTISGTIGTFPDSLYGKYFTIIDIKAQVIQNGRYVEMDLKEVSDERVFPKIILRNESNKDTLYWTLGPNDFSFFPFFLVPYFEKLRSKYLNQNLVLKYNDRTIYKLQNLIDVNTGAIVNFKYGEVWTCSDISFIDSKDWYYLHGFYFLKNGDKEVKIDLESKLIQEYFMLETEFKRQELEKKKKEEERKREEQERVNKEQKDRIKFKNDCIAKWGQKIGSYIADGKVVLSMNKDMCVAAWGNPISINKTIVRGLISEQWVYGWGTYLYFDNGSLSAIQY